MSLNNSTKLLILCGLVLAASAGFFVSAVVFKGTDKTRYEPQFERGPCDRDQFLDDKSMTSRKYSKSGQRFMMQGPPRYEIDSLLGLSKDQIAAMDQHGQAFDSLRKALSKKIKDTEIRLHDALNAETVSEADLKAIRTELLVLNEQRLDSKIATVRFFVSTLTPEQNKKLREIHSKVMKQIKEEGKTAPREMNNFGGDEYPGEMESGEPRQDGQGPRMDGNGPNQDGQGPRHNKQGPRQMPPPPPLQER